jgi:hypothetical protein
VAWIILEGLDRSGKSSLAEIYKNQGFQVVHMSAPDKKYFKKGYSGPSYLEEILEMYARYAGKDIVFDRSPYGELVWPEIFGRESLLNDEDFEYIRQIEFNNDSIRILMYDQDENAHWQRCVDNNEPLNKSQFFHATRLYENMSKTYEFEKRQLTDFKKIQQSNDSRTKESDSKLLSKGENLRDSGVSGSLRHSDSGSDSSTEDPELRRVVHTKLDKKLERANAIRDLLVGPIIKKKGDAFSQLEKDIRSFLEQQLESIFNEPKTNDFTEEEIQILKIYAKRIKEKLG